MAKKKLRAFGMTCGMGSMLIGAKKLGYEIVGNVEWRRYYNPKTFETYFGAPQTKTLEEFPGGIPKDIDLMMGHPECGGFSYMNHNVKKSHKNPMDIPLFVEAVKKIKPKFVAMDDLPLSLKEAFTEDHYQELLPDYDVYFEWISNYHYGNLQAYRKRYFMIAARKDQKFVFIPGETDNAAKVMDVIADLPEKDDPDFNHEHVNPKDMSQGFKNMEGNKLTNEEVAEEFKKIKPGRNLYYKNKEGEIKKKIGPCRTNWYGYAHVLMGCDNIFHPKTGYPLTIRERARIQGCPDDLIFYGNHVEQIKQTGKFMPVQFCTYFADMVKHHIEGKEFKASGERKITSNKHIDKAKMNYCEKYGFGKLQKKVCEQCWLKNTCSKNNFDLLDEK